MVNNPISALTSGVAAGVPAIPATDHLEAIGLVAGVSILDPLQTKRDRPEPVRP
jgi:hypothetical protein